MQGTKGLGLQRVARGAADSNYMKLCALRSRCRISFECMCCSAPPSCRSQLITVHSAKGARFSGFCRSWSYRVSVEK